MAVRLWKTPIVTLKEVVGRGADHGFVAMPWAIAKLLAAVAQHQLEAGATSVGLAR